MLVIRISSNTERYHTVENVVPIVEGMHCDSLIDVRVC